jgi:hypothetical protein
MKGARIESSNNEPSHRRSLANSQSRTCPTAALCAGSNILSQDFDALRLSSIGGRSEAFKAKGMKLTLAFRAGFASLALVVALLGASATRDRPTSSTYSASFTLTACCQPAPAMIRP